MSETGLLAFQLSEIMPAVEAFLVCFFAGLFLICLRMAYLKCIK